MLETVACTRIIAHASTSSLVHHVQESMKAKGVELHITELPGLSDVFPRLGGKLDAASTADVRPYPPLSRPTNLRTPSLYVHSSGSTDYPKSIHFTYRRILLWMDSCESSGCLCLGISQ